MRNCLLIFFFSFGIVSAAQADECKDIAKIINQSSREALQTLNQDPKRNQEAVQEIFKQCRKFVDLKCTQWNWLGTEKSLRSYCYEAIVTEDRNQKRAGVELLESSKRLAPTSGSQKLSNSTK